MAKTRLKNILEIAKDLGIKESELELYGNYIAKIDLGILKRLKNRPRGKYILVTAITPTPLGEGKTVTTIGLSMALNKLGESAICCLRQPSLGPLFGIKGSATGSGKAQVLPRDKISLHFTADTHAVTASHNLCAAFLDNVLFHGNYLNIDPATITWRRVMDISDRSLRRIKTSLNYYSGFDITCASEIMAILALALDYKDLRRRISQIVLAYTYQGKPITAEDIKVAGAATALLKDALKPNLIQTTQNTACFMHSGPFGNIAQGNNSVLADKIAISLAKFVITESGFGADCGAEKFFNIKCRIGGLRPDLAVLVCSLRGIRSHAKTPGLASGREGFGAGLENLKKQIENVRIFGVPVVVAINKFSSDQWKEIDFVLKKAKDFGANQAVVSEVWSKGASGAFALAHSVMQLAKEKNNFHFLYSLESSIKEKIKTIATKIYGAKSVKYSKLAEKKIQLYTKSGYQDLPICMAKTHLSLSHDAKLKGCPKDFILPIEDIRLAAGAGFIYPLCGNIQTMPGLPKHPRGEKIDIDNCGNILGL